MSVHFSKTSRSPLLILVAGFMLCLQAACTPDAPAGPAEVKTVSLPDQVDFNFHVKPILSDRCFTCHGPDVNKRKAGLSLHTEAGLFAEAKDGSKIVVPGDAEKSRLYSRISTTDPGALMPPAASNLKLSAEEIALLRKWIDQGAKWEKHWAFLPVRKAPTPAQAWGKGMIDAWTYAAMQRQGLSPSPEAAPARLLRRLSLDTRGLPPGRAEIEQFTAKGSVETYAATVDKYLASVDHAERLASWWLDLARYADTHGYQDDLERENWPWRDWVIHAFQTNQPYDQFVTWQLAGDLLPEANAETILATTFNRNHKITQEGGVIDEEFLVDYVADRTATTFTAFQALTVECARCHDHKYDPISQKDFYAAFDFFNHVPERGRVDYGQFAEPTLTITDAELASLLDFVQAPDSVLPIHPMVMQDAAGLRTTHILGRGQYDQPQEEVEAATPEAVLAFGDRPRNRLGLAQWLFDPANPLTARVLVNRIWQHYFGRGIVATADDFGSQGALPTHPELLDALAQELMDSGWDLRALERRILLSATYRQDSKVTPEALEIDPDNIYLARAPQLRLSAEMVRDQVLALSQLLVPKVGGPPVKPYQPAGLWAEKTSGGGYTTYEAQTGEHLYRKSLYTYWKRTVPPPAMLTFDAPTRDICTVSRHNTNTPLQALVLLNDPQQIEAARSLAALIQVAHPANPDQGIREAFTTVLCRPAEAAELGVLQDLYQTELAQYQDQPALADSLLMVGDRVPDPQLSAPRLAAMTVVVSTLFNLSETVTRL